MWFRRKLSSEHSREEYSGFIQEAFILLCLQMAIRYCEFGFKDFSMLLRPVFILYVLGSKVTLLKLSCCSRPVQLTNHFSKSSRVEDFVAGECAYSLVKMTEKVVFNWN